MLSFCLDLFSDKLIFKLVALGRRELRALVNFGTTLQMFDDAVIGI